MHSLKKKKKDAVAGLIPLLLEPWAGDKKKREKKDRAT